MTPSRHQSASNDTGGVPHLATPGEASVAQGQQVNQRRRLSFAFRNWRVRSKLVAILLVPLLAVLGFAGLRLRDVLDAQRQAHRAEQMAQFTRQVVVLAHALEAERDQSAVNLGSSHQDNGTELKSARDTTDKQVREYQRQTVSLKIKELGPVLSDALGTIDSHIAKLNGLHLSVDTNGDWASVDAEYQSFVGDLLALEQDIAQGTDDAALNDAIEALIAVSRYTAAADSTRGFVGYLIANGSYSEGDRTEVFRRDAQEAAAKGVVDSTLTTIQRKVYDKALPESILNPVNRLTDDQILPTASGQRIPVAIDDWYKVTGARQQALASVEDQIARQVLDRTQDLGSSASKQALLESLVVLAVLLATVILALLTVRSLVRPLRRLRSRALDVAYTELPGAVQRMRDTDQAEGTASASAHVDSRDEVGEVAEAFDSVHREAVRHAGEQAMLRRNVSTMFVNLSRRTQSLVERQLRLIDTLEGSEQDPDSLENLFQLDHLATRMRRNAENLLVLAGAEPGRRWTQPVALIDVLRAAAAEVEQYQRVVHTFVTGREIEGRAVGDVVHLVAELLENASEFSPPDTHVVVSARSMSGGAGVMIEIEDQGIGMSADDMSTANDRLSANAEFEPQLSRMMGLYVVGRLAARHGIRVQLRPAPSGGLTALIHLPPEVVVDPMTQTGSELPPMTSPMGAPLLGPGDDLAHPDTGMPGPMTGPISRPDLPPVPLPSYGLAGLTAGAAGMPRPPVGRALPPPGPSAGPPTRFAPPLELGATGEIPVLPAAPAAVPSGPPPLPRREPNTAWPASGPLPGPRAGSPSDALSGNRSGLDTPTESVRPLLPSRDTVGSPAEEQVGSPEDIAAALAGEPAVAAPTAQRPAGAVPNELEDPLPQRVDLDEDTIVPHRRDEDLPIFAGLESEWFLRREDDPMPPPPGLPLEEWGISLDDLPEAATVDPPAAETPAEVPAQAPAVPEPVAARVEPQPEPVQPAGPPPLPLRHRTAAAAAPGAPDAGEPGLPALPVRQRPGMAPAAGPQYPSAPQPGGQPLAASAGPPPTGPPSSPPMWASPADEGWRAAERLGGPPADAAGTTSAGLPIRVPMAHFVPGAAPTPLRQSAAAQARGQAARQTQPRSPEAVRGMLSSYQRGLRQGREAGRHRHQDSDDPTYANQEHS
jgi:signal transduction histidine kinase